MALLTRAAPRVAILAAVAVLSAAGSAGAVSMITGRQIKNGTVTGADLRNGSVRSVDVLDGAVSTGDVRNGGLGLADLGVPAREALRGAQGAAGPPGVPAIRGYRLVTRSIPVAAGERNTVQANCPADLPTAISVQGLFSVGNEPVRTGIPSPSSGVVFGTNSLAVANTLTVQLVCVLVH